MLHIDDCPKLKSLPDFLFKTSLQEFDVSGSPILCKRYQIGTGEDWAKISHLPNILIDDGNFFCFFSGSSFYFAPKKKKKIFLIFCQNEIITNNVGWWIYQILNNLIRLFHLLFNVYEDLAHFLHFRWWRRVWWRRVWWRRAVWGQRRGPMIFAFLGSQILATGRDLSMLICVCLCRQSSFSAWLSVAEVWSSHR